MKQASKLTLVTPLLGACVAMYDGSVQQCELIKFDKMSVDNYGN